MQIKDNVITAYKICTAPEMIPNPEMIPKWTLK